MKFSGNQVDYSLMEAEAMFHLFAASRRFRPNGNTRPTTWAYRRVQGAIQDTVRASRYLQWRYESIDGMENPVFPAPEEHLDDKIDRKTRMRQVIAAMYRSLPRDQVHAIVACFLHGRTDQSVAHEMKISTGALGKLKAAGIQGIRDAIGGTSGIS